MKRQCLLIVLLVLFVFSSEQGLFSQPAPPPGDATPSGEPQRRPRPPRPDAIFEGGRPPAGTISVVGRSFIHSINNGFGNTMAIMDAARNQNMRTELGLDDDQTNQLRTLQGEMQLKMMMLVPQYANRFKSMTDADHAKIQADIEKELKEVTDKVTNVVTSEQQQKARTVVFQTLGGLDSPVMNLDAMSALNLSEEQKNRVKKTFDELEKERLTLLEDGLKLAEKAMKLGAPNLSPEDRRMLDEERLALEARAFASGKKLGDALRVHLTDSQRELEKKLLANRPGFLPPLPRQMRPEAEAGYAPGADSWRPGQGATIDRGTERPFPVKEGDD